MNLDELRAVVAAGETFTVEFKRAAAGALNDADIVDAVVCLANGEGGLLLVGVELTWTSLEPSPAARPQNCVASARPRPGLS